VERRKKFSYNFLTTSYNFQKVVRKQHTPVRETRNLETPKNRLLYKSYYYVLLYTCIGASDQETEIPRDQESDRVTKQTGSRDKEQRQEHSTKQEPRAKVKRQKRISKRSKITHGKRQVG
jgi:hypothetical protein